MEWKHLRQRRGEKPSCTHCEKEGHEEENWWKMHPKMRPRKNERKERQKTTPTMQKIMSLN